MKWFKNRLVWQAGFAFITLSGVSFILEVCQSARLRSWPEAILVWILVIVGTLFVGFYWGRKWYEFRDYFTSEAPLPYESQIRKYAIGVPCLIVAIILIIQGFLYMVKLHPEFAESQNILRENPSVIAKVGIIRESNFDACGSMEEGNGRFVYYQFQIVGSLGKDTFKVTWHDEENKLVPTKIEEISSDETATTMWTSSGK